MAVVEPLVGLAVVPLVGLAVVPLVGLGVVPLVGLAVVPLVGLAVVPLVGLAVVPLVLGAVVGAGVVVISWVQCLASGIRCININREHKDTDSNKNVSKQKI